MNASLQSLAPPEVSDRSAPSQDATAAHDAFQNEAIMSSLAIAPKFSPNNALAANAKTTKGDGVLGQMVKSADYGLKALASRSEKPPELAKSLPEPKTNNPVPAPQFLVLTDPYKDISAAAKTAGDNALAPKSRVGAA